MKQTAMQQLKEKIQTVIGEMDGELSSYESGYKQCLINIQNDIDLQMLAMEKEQIINACISLAIYQFKPGAETSLNNITYWVEEYYKRIYGK